MDAEMLLITHVYQPIVTPPAIAIEGYLAPNRGLERLLGGIRDDLRVDLSLPFQDSENDVLPPAPCPFSPNTAGAKRGFTHFNLAGERR